MDLNSLQIQRRCVGLTLAENATYRIHPLNTYFKTVVTHPEPKKCEYTGALK